MIEKSDFGLHKGSDDDDRIINSAFITLKKCFDDIALGSKTPRKAAAKILEALDGADLTTF